MQHKFLPQSVPSYSATEVLAALKTKYPEFYYKEATLNPTNPRDRATGWEVDIVNQFRSARGHAGIRRPARHARRARRCSSRGRCASPTPACLRCHSSVEAAPKTMVDKYGPANGFGWQMNEVVGAQIVSVPLGAGADTRRAFVQPVHRLAGRPCSSSPASC